ncbi:MAG: hypothetical protein GY804_14085 [Alphaproteobacteria bacterium]|nr:hypothetical protein [Alphaproteobacteria bacterium]
MMGATFAASKTLGAPEDLVLAGSSILLMGAASYRSGVNAGIGNAAEKQSKECTENEEEKADALSKVAASSWKKMGISLLLTVAGGVILAKTVVDGLPNLVEPEHLKQMGDVMQGTTFGSLIAGFSGSLIGSKQEDEKAVELQKTGSR